MSTYQFEDWDARQYDDPAIGRVEPGETRDLDAAPEDGHWTLVPESSEPAGNRGFTASSPDLPTSTPDATVPGNDDNEPVPGNTDLATETDNDSEQAKGDD